MRDIRKALVTSLMSLFAAVSVVGCGPKSEAEIQAKIDRDRLKEERKARKDSYKHQEELAEDAQEHEVEMAEATCPVVVEQGSVIIDRRPVIVEERIFYTPEPRRDVDLWFEFRRSSGGYRHHHVERRRGHHHEGGGGVHVGVEVHGKSKRGGGSRGGHQSGRRNGRYGPSPGHR